MSAIPESSDLLDQSSLGKKDKLKTLTELPNDVFQQLLLTIMRVRMNVSLAFFLHLSYLFDVHSSTISRIFRNLIDVLNEVLVPLCVLA